MFFYTSLISPHSLPLTPFSLSKVLGTSKSHNVFLVSTHVDKGHLPLTSVTFSITRTGVIAFWLSASMSSYFITWWPPSAKETRASWDIRNILHSKVSDRAQTCGHLTTNRKITLNFAQVGAYLEPHCQQCSWTMIRSSSPDKLRISAPVH